MNWNEVEIAMEEGWSARLPFWSECKSIRHYKESDIEFLANPLPETKGVIMEDCKKPCDCSIGVWPSPEEEVKATNWQLVNNKA
jgi:hypothetical protein